MNKNFIVEGMSCPKCVAHVKEALEKIPGISNVIVDLEKKLVSLDHSALVPMDLIKKALEAAGYSAKDL